MKELTHEQYTELFNAFKALRAEYEQFRMQSRVMESPLQCQARYLLRRLEGE